MIKIAKFALRHSTRTLSIVIMVIILSLYGIFHIPVGLYPQFSYPEVNVSYIYSSQDPELIARRFTPYIEGFIWSLNGVNAVKSITSCHSINIHVTLKHGINPERFAIKVIDALKNAKLPEFFNGPFITGIKQNKQCDFEFYVKGPDRELLKDSLLVAIKSIDGVKKIEVFGETTERILLIPNLFAMKSTRITHADVANSLSPLFENLMLPFGNNILFELEVAHTPPSFIKIKGIPLNDLFTIKTQNSENIFLTDGISSLLFRVYYNQKTNKIHISTKIKQTLKEIEKKRGRIFSITYDVGKENKKAFKKLLYSFISGTTFLFLILFLFERNFFVSVIAIFIAILSSLIALSVFFTAQIEVNIITLSGLVFGLGLLVDTAIVFFEEFYENSLKMNKIKAIFTTSATIFSPLIASTMTSLVVFIPFLYASQDIRLRYKTFLIALGIALLSSLLVTYLLLPPFFLLIRIKNKSKGVLEKAIFFYRKLISYLTRRPTISLFVYVLVAVSGTIIFTRLNKGEVFTFTKDNNNLITINISMPSGGIDPEILNEQIVLPVVKEINRYKSLASSYDKIHSFAEITHTGARIEVRINDASKHTSTISELRMFLERYLANFGGVNIVMHGGATEDFINAEGNVKPFMLTLPVYGYNYDKLLNITQKIAEQLKKESDFAYVINNFYYTPSVSAYYLNTDFTHMPAILDLYGMSHEAMFGYYKGKQVLKEKPMPDYYELISSGFLLDKKSTKRSIMRNNRYFMVNVGFVYQGPPNSLQRRLRAFKKTHPLPTGFYYTPTEAVKKDAYMRDFLLALYVTIVIIILIITAMFNRIRPSFVVFLSIPFTLSGIFFSFYLSHTAFDINAILATLITLGIAVNDSIFLVKKCQLTKNIPDAAMSRARSILYTSITTITTALPFMVLYQPSEMWYKFAYAIIGGISFSTFYALFLLPAFIRVFGGTFDRNGLFTSHI